MLVGITLMIPFIVNVPNIKKLYITYQFINFIHWTAILYISYMFLIYLHLIKIHLNMCIYH